MGLGTKAYLIGAVLTFYSSFAAALGLGEITLNSALNQPLDAKIQLLHVRELSEREIIVGLASSEEFARAGVDRGLFLTSLKFRVDLNSAGGPVVHVTSENPVREPFVNFLLAAQWPSGKLLREYTLLVDLPVFSGERAAPVQAAPRARESSAPSRSSAQTRPTSKASVSTQPSVTVDEYGPVGANENLWSIASKVRPDSSVTVQQTMLALQKLNPQAFINNNINLLRRGQVLRVPDKDTIAALSAREAVNAVADQNRRWNQPDAAADETAAQLEGSKTFTPTRSESAAPEGRISLSGNTATAAGSGNGAGEGTDGAVENRLAVTQEELDAASRENADLKSRLSSVEEQIATMEKLVEVSNEELRALELSAQQTNAAEPAVVSEETKAEQPEQTPASTPAVPEKQNSLLELLMDNLLYIALGAGALVAAAGLWFYMSRRDDGFDYDFDEDLDEDHGAEPDSEPRSSDQRTAAIATLNSDVDDESAFAEPAFAAEAETEDVVGESDIHIAYGQYDQAEEKLSRALEREPTNIAMRLKLLEVFAAQDDAVSFDDHFAKIHILGDPAAIDRAEMLRQSIEVAEPFDLAAQDTAQFERILAGRYESTDTQIVGYNNELGGDEEYSLVDDTLEFASDNSSASAVSDDWDLTETVDVAAAEDATVIPPHHPVDQEADEDDPTRIKPVYDSTLHDSSDDIATVGAAATEIDDDLHAEIESSLDAIEDSYEISGPAERADELSSVEIENASQNLDDDTLADLDFDLDDIDSDLSFDDVELDLEFEGFDKFAEPASEGELATDSFDLPEHNAVDAFSSEVTQPVGDSAISYDYTDDSLAGKNPDSLQADEHEAKLAMAATPNETSSTIPDDFNFDSLSDLEFDADSSEDRNLAAIAASDLAESDVELGELDFTDLGELDIDDDQIDGAGVGVSAQTAKSFDGATLGNNLAGEPLTGDADHDDPESVVQGLADAEQELSFDSEDDGALDLTDEVNLDDLDKDFAALTSDFEVGLGSVDGSMDEPLTQFDELDIEDDDLDSLDDDGAKSSHVAGETEVTAISKGATSARDSELEEFEIPDFDPDSDDDSNLDFLSDNDETATKLDLARAYIDMGDTDGAKDILDEIAEEGNDQQKQEAETLLSRIA